MKVKILKRLISISCAAALAISGTLNSVGAIGFGEDIAKLTKETNVQIQECISQINILKQQIKKIQNKKTAKMKKFDEEINLCKKELEKSEIKNKTDKQIMEIQYDINVLKVKKMSLENRIRNIKKKTAEEIYLTKFKPKFDEFIKFKNDNKFTISNGSTEKTIKSAIDAYNNNDFDTFLTLSATSIDKIDEFKSGIHKKNPKKTETISDEVISDNEFKMLLAGNQNENNKFEGININGKPANIINTCGIFMITTLKNIYNYVNNKEIKPIKGFKNVIQNYKNMGGNMDYISSIADESRCEVGLRLAVDDMNDILKKLSIGNYLVSFNEIIENTYGISPEQVEKKINEKKDTMAKQIKKLLISYMKNKSFAPIGSVSGGHWQLIVKYDEKSNKVLKLDSNPAEAVWVNLDLIVNNSLNISSIQTFNQTFCNISCDLPIFTKQVQFDSINFSSEFDNCFSEDGLNQMLKEISKYNK